MTTDPRCCAISATAKVSAESVALGYAGWGSQLEGELAAGGWFTVPEEPKLVFDVDRDKMWDEAMKRRSIPL
jgi:putative transcriptional regulator